MRTTTFTLHGKTYHLCLNAAALFAIYDRFPEAESIAEPLAVAGKRGFEAVCAYLSILGTQGELVRRFEGYDKGEMPTEGYFRAMLSPLDDVTARAAIRRAIDLGLQELNSKKAPPASHGLNILTMLRTLLG